MADTGIASDLRPGSSRGPVKGSPNLSGGWIVMLLSGLIAAVLFFFATQETSNRVDVAVLARDVSAGQQIDASAFSRTQIAAGDAQLSRLIRYEDRGQYVGWVAAGPMSAGDLVAKSALREPAAAQQRRSMSIPVDKSHANNGNIRAGDRIDVIAAEAPESDAYVARGIEVLSVSEDASGGLGAVSQFVIVVAVDEGQAVAIAQVVANGKFDIVRSTGAAGGTASTSTASGSTSQTTTTTTTTTSPSRSASDDG